MRNYTITADSTVDLGRTRMEELGVKYAMLVYMLDGVQSPDDMSDESALKIYSEMRNGKTVTTSQPEPEAFVALWEDDLKAGRDILYIGFSSGLSGTVNCAQLARNQLLEQYPERSIYIVDSLCASGGEGMLLQYAIKNKAEGMGARENYEAMEALKLRINHWYTVSELSYLKRGGRVSATAAFVGDMLSIKPVMDMDDSGHLIPREKAKGRKGSIKRMFEHMQELVDLPANDFFHITHADCREDAERLKTMIEEKYPGVPANISFVGAVIGSHCGPGTLALFFIGRERTKDGLN